ncbi:MAG: M48 family metallopeptidase [Chlorobi bacterium]|nr:M48 family metallopeptidase [Chlorobiota bacterium]
MLRLFSLVGVITIFAWACSKVPITGRKQLNLVPESMLIALSFDEYQKIQQTYPPEVGTPRAKMVERVGWKMAKATEEFLRQNGMENRIKEFQWEFKLLKADSIVNAFCLPGGKIAFFTGIMPIAQNEAGVAVIMGHEIAHAIARHGNERLSQALLAQMGGIALDVALKEKPEETRQLFLAAYGVGVQVGVLLPYSRKQELEADRIGLILMAIAGYNPEEAIKFWERMEKMAGGASVPEFLSTHPSHKRRIEQLKKLLPEAMKYYNQK